MAPRGSGSSRPKSSRRSSEPDVPDVEMQRAEEFVEELDDVRERTIDPDPVADLPPPRPKRTRAPAERRTTAGRRPSRAAAAAADIPIERDAEPVADRSTPERAAPAETREREIERPAPRPIVHDSDLDFDNDRDEPAPTRSSSRESSRDHDRSPRDTQPSEPQARESHEDRGIETRTSDNADEGQLEYDSGDGDARDFDARESSEPGESGGAGTSGDQPQRRRRRRRRRNGQNDGPPPSGGGSNAGGGGQPQNQRHRRNGQNNQNGPNRNRYNDRGPSRDRSSSSRGDREDYRERGPDNAPIIGTTQGVLELHPKGYGFLRDPKNNYAALKTDSFVPGSLIEKCKLREGVLIKGEVCAGTRGQGPRLKNILDIDGLGVEDYQKVKTFDELTAINPFEQIKLETGPTPVTMRVMDLLTPIGKGQRALIVAPPRTGKTMLLQEIANSVSVNHPEVHLIVLLIDERPEEVTEMSRKVRGEVIASSMDRDVESHVRISQLIFERGKRLAEQGKDCFILLDSITRTARAFNKWGGNSGRTMTGGLDVKAMDIPKKMFGTARRFDEGGSLTVVGTALVQTGSTMDEIIFQEFKGTGNMELVLNRQLADRRIWPAIDIKQSGTRREEKILAAETLDGITLLRRSLVSLDSVEAMEQLTKTLARFPSNKEFLARVKTML